MLIKFLVYSAVYLLFSFLVFRVIIRKDYLSNQKLSPLSYLLEIIVFALHANSIYLFLPVNWPDFPPLPGNLILKLLSLFIFCFGLIVLLIAWFGLGSKRSFGQDKNTLNTIGIYHYSRNPQLVGYGILLLGFAILFISWYSIGWFVQYLIISYFMIRSEEEFLSLRYGEEYEIYCSTAPRVIKLF